MNEGDRLQISIEDMTSDGRGVGKINGFTVFVPGAFFGDTAFVQITKVKKNYAVAEVMEISFPSDRRNDDFRCESLEAGCGGCSYSMLEYSAQLELKERQVRENLKRLGGVIDPKVMPIIGMDAADNNGTGHIRYRNKAVFPVSTVGSVTRKGGSIIEGTGDPIVGFYKGRTKDPVDSEDCYLQAPPAMAAAAALRRFMKEDDISGWDPVRRKGLMRHLIVKTAFATGEVMVIFVINGDEIPDAAKLVEMTDEYIYETGYSLESAVISTKKRNGNVKKNDKKRVAVKKRKQIEDVLGEKNFVIAGKPVIRDMIGKLNIEITPRSFSQVNPAQRQRLYDKIRYYCGVGEGESSSAARPVILDIYCGTGAIGLHCADYGEYVIGIESEGESVICANRNAVINGIVNARFIRGKAEEILPEYIDFRGGSESERIDEDIAGYIRKAGTAIIDPPRAGCRPALLNAIAKTRIDRIIYVSCDPATMARDIKHLNTCGYKFIEATPIDMFPMTGHVETVCLMSRSKGPAHKYCLFT